MPKVILTAQVEDAVKWEAGFLTHDDVRRSYALNTPVEYSVAGNDVALYIDTANLDTLKDALQSPETVAAMAFDGVKRGTVKMFVVDKKCNV